MWVPSPWVRGIRPVPSRIDSVVLDVVRILIRIQSTCGEHNLVVGIIS